MVTVNTSLYTYHGPDVGSQKSSKAIDYKNVIKYDVRNDELHLVFQNQHVVYAKGSWQSFIVSDIEDSR